MSYTRERYNASKRPTWSADDLRAEFDRVQRGIAYPTVIDVRDFGVQRNGKTDDYTAVQKALNAANDNGGARLLLPRGTYKLGTRLTGRSNVEMIGEPGAVIDYSEATKVGSFRYGINAEGSLGTSYSLTANVSRGVYSVTASSSDAANLAVDDWVLIGSTSTDYYPFAAHNISRGEIKRVRSVSSGTINLCQATYDAYTTANGAFVRKVNFLENFRVRGLHFRGPDTPEDGAKSIVCSFANGVHISGCEFDEADQNAVELTSCIRAEVHDNHFRGVFYDGVDGLGFNFYGVVLLNATQWVKVYANHGERLRHLYVNHGYSTGNGHWGQPRFVEVFGNTATDMQGGDDGVSYAYGHRGVGDEIDIYHNTADGCHAGCWIRGPGVKFRNNIVRNFYYAGVVIHEDIRDAENIYIEDNDIGLPADHGAGVHAQARGIYGDLTNATTLRDVVIRGNTIQHDNTAQAAILLEGAVSAQGLVIERNKIHVGVDTTQWQIESYQPGAIIRDNEFYGKIRHGIRARAADQIITGNIGRADAQKDTGEFIYSELERTWIEGNKAYQTHRCVRLATGADNSAVFNNIGDCTSAALTFVIPSALTGVRQHGNIDVGGNQAWVVAADGIDVQDAAGNSIASIARGNTAQILLDGADGSIAAGSVGMLETGGSVALASRASAEILLDNDNNATTSAFRVRTNSASFGSGGSVLLTVAEDTGVTASPNFTYSAERRGSTASPAQITGDQNDYAPTGQGVETWRLSSDASRNITGIANGAAGRHLRIINVGAQNIVLQNQNAGSTDANKIITGTGADVTLAADDTAQLWYDATTARWRIVGNY